MDHVTFQEAVERMAARIGFELHYEDGAQATEHGNRARLLAANAAAEKFFQEQLSDPRGADRPRLPRRARLRRGRRRALRRRLRPQVVRRARATTCIAQGFTEDELVTAGLLSTGDRGNAYDRFRGRLIWPIRDITGATVGFGARKLLPDDQDKGPKYLNTPETPGLPQEPGALRARSRPPRHREGQAGRGRRGLHGCHGLPPRGRHHRGRHLRHRFGVDHIKIIRRVLGDVDNADSTGTGEVIFTFDPDEAGQKAASRAFAEEQRFAAQTFVAVAPDDLDPCDLRRDARRRRGARR